MLSTISTTPSLSSSNTATKMMTKCHQQQRYHPQRCQIQHHHNGISSSLSSLSSLSFNGLNKWLWTAVLFGLLIVTASAIDENSKSSPAASSLSPRDEIYIDDERLEGSGRGGIHDDLEKDHDFSGSGFGPDDEDSDSDYRHHSHKHQTGKSNINKNIDDNDFITTSRNNNNQNNQNQNIHQISSSNSGINNQGNTGIISSGGSSATSGNTGLNTIETNNHNKQFNSSISFSPTQTITTIHNNNTITNTTTTPYPNTDTLTSTIATTTITTQQNTEHNTTQIIPVFPDINNNNNNQQNQGKNVLPPSINAHHPHSSNTDDDDFDIEEEEEGGILAGSGDGGLIDHDTDDDDHTGDVDADGGDNDDGDLLPDITKYQHGIYNGATTSTNGKADHKPINTNDDFEEEVDFDHHQPIDRDNDDNEDDNAEEEEGDKIHKTHSEDGTEIYTDIEDETTNTGSSSSVTTEKRPGGINTQGGTNIHDLDTNSINSLPPDTKLIEQTTGNEVSIMNANDDDRTASFFAQPGILAAVIGGAVVGLLCAILVVMFIVYRMRKKDEGSYALDEPKRSPAMNSYAKNATNREFYA